MQLEYSDKVILSDLYQDAASRELLSSICIVINDPSETQKKVYGVLCQDIDMIQYYFSNYVTT